MSLRAKWLHSVFATGLYCSLVIALFVSPFLHAASIEFGNAIPGITTITKPVISMREQRFRHLIRQQTDFSCGAAALATVMRYAYGLKVTEEDMLDGLFAVSDVDLVRQQAFLY